MKSLLNSLLGGSTTQQTGITLGGIPIPFLVEPLHFFCCGSTGTGKTSLITELLCGAIPRGDRVIVCDPAGHHLSRFWQDGDTVLNPFDRRSPGWSIFNEVRKNYDYDRLAHSLIPDGVGSDKQWHHYAQVLCSEVMRVLMIRGEGNTEQLMHWLTVAKSDELAELLVGTAVQGLFDRDAAKALASTRFILTTYIKPHKYLQPGDFSLLNWLIDENGGNLFISWREDMQTALMPLVTTWVDILCNAVLSLPPSQDRRIWLSLDEVGALGRLSALESALTRGRKQGLRVVAGLQATAQLDLIYGRESATVLRSCFRNLIVLGIAKTDPDTAEMLSKSLGEREVDREQHSRSEGAQGITKNVTLQRIKERIAIPSEITELPNLTAFLALAGNTATKRIQITPRNLPLLTSPMEE